MAWEIESRGIKDEMLKEPGPNGRWLFRIQEMPGLGRDAVPIRHTIMAAPDMLAALKLALPFIPNDAMTYSKGTYGDRVYIADTIRAAIAKTKGAA